MNSSVWKERQEAYLALKSAYENSDFSYTDLNSIISDNNQVAHETGLSAVALYVAHDPQKSIDLLPLLVEKCIGLPKVRPLVQQMLLNLTAANPALVVDALIPYWDHKTPKTVIGSIAALSELIRNYGHAIPLKPILKNLAKLFDHRDKAVRTEQKELNTLFESASISSSPVMTLLNAKPQIHKVDSAKPAPPPVVEFDFSDPQTVLDKIPKSFYTDMESSAWKERKEALETLLPLVSFTKIQNDYYHELLNVLARKLQDSNLVVTILAANCIEKLGKGLGANFTIYRNIVVNPLMQRLKEKKQTLVDAIQKCLEICYSCSPNIVELFDDVDFGLNHNSPQVKAETIKWLIGCLDKNSNLPKPKLKKIVEQLTKTLYDGLDMIRERSAEALAKLMQTHKEELILPFLQGVDKAKVAKIYEYFNNVKSSSTPSKPRVDAKPKLERSSESSRASIVTGTSRTSSSKSLTDQKPTKTKVKGEASTRQSSVTTLPQVEIKYEFSDESAADYMQEYSQILEQFSDSNWKTRLQASNDFYNAIKENPELKAEAVIRILLVRPGWKENNFQVATVMITVFQHVCGYASFSNACAELLVQGLVNKLGDLKQKKPASDCLDQVIQNSSLELCFSNAIEALNKQKAPKFVADGLLWMSSAINDFGIGGLNIPKLLSFLKVSLNNPNLAVRNNAVSVLGSIGQFAGPSLKDLLTDANPAMRQAIDAELEKSGQTKPLPILKQVKTAAPTTNIQDLIPRSDLSTMITSDVVDKISDSQWKERKAALDQILALLEEVKYKIGPFLGSDFVQTLTQRLTDSNKNIASQAADICGHLAASMGKPFEKYAKQFLSPMLVQLNDQKSQVRANVLKNLSKIKTVIGWGLTLPILAQSLISENPTLRKDLLKYISTEIDEFSNISVLVQPVLACAQDRNLDVRKNAQGLLAILAEHMDIAQIENIANELYRGSAFSSISNIIEGLKGEVAEVKKPVVFEAADKKKPVSRQVSTTSLKREIAPAAPKDAENPIISVDLKAKDARSQMDKGLLKWSFEVPRKELIDLLADQCAGNLSSQVCSLLFSTDHYKEKDYLIGLKLLDDYIAPNDSHIQNECVANCDIILKYVTVRFFDTNTSILIKTLDLLEHLIAVLDTAGYFLSDYEANCFLPFFVQKTGDPKESIRMKMRQILKQLGRVYPVSKLFGHLLRGLESKNAKTRQECLDELSQILQRNGQDAFNPSKSLPLIAALISDRDASVRNSSLAFVCQAYKILGEEVFSYAGRLSDKDLGMIKERLKRMPTSDTSRASTPVKQQPIVKSKTPPNVPKEFTLDLDEIETITPGLSVAATPSKVFEQDPIELFVTNFGKNSTEDVELLKQIDKLVSSSPLKLRLKANDVASVLVDRLAIEFEGYKNNFNNGKVSKYITNTLVQLFNNMEIAQSLTADVLDKCIRQVLLRLVDAKLLEQDGSFSKALNVLMVRVIENSSPNCTFKSLLSILKDITDQNLNDKYSELVMKCMWKITKVLGNLISSRRIVVEDLLFDIHIFLLHAPPQYWKRKSLESKDTQADMPLRTVKTIIHEVVGALGGEAMDYALLLPNSQQNHVVNYIRQMVINLEKKNKPVAAPKTDLAHQLDDIFTLISDKENTKNGILKLYEFQRQNPAEFRMVEDRISQTGSYFQGYIHRGLAGLKQSELQITTEKMASSGANSADSYKETLAKLQRMFVGKEKVFRLIQLDMNEEPLPVQPKEQPIEIKEKSRAVADLKERLARMKQSMDKN